eukprot:287118_1
MSTHTRKPKIGDQVNYWNIKSKKYHQGEVIDKTKTHITIQYWRSIVSPKTITMHYPSDWRYKVSQNHILPRANNTIFPSWVKLSALCILYDPHKASQTVVRIAKYKDGSSITLFYIQYPRANSFGIKTIKTITIDITNVKHHNISRNCTYINFMRHEKQNVLFPYLGPIELEHHHDQLNDIQNNKLIKMLWKNTSQSSVKSTQQQIKKMQCHPCDDAKCSYITTSKLQYGVIMESVIFPFDINRLIISFLAQQMIYVCPPTPMQYDEAQMWQFSEKQNKDSPETINRWGTQHELSVIGIEFMMRKEVVIAGFELNNIELLGRYKHKICFNKNIETVQLQCFEQLRNAQFVFSDHRSITLRTGTKYTVEIKVNANVPCYQCHETPENVKGFVQNQFW